MAIEDKSEQPINVAETAEKSGSEPTSEVEKKTTDKKKKPNAVKPKKKGKKKPPPRKPPKTTKQLLVGLLIKIVVIVLFFWLLFSFVLGFRIHYGNNMYPSIHDGDMIFSFRLQKPYINAPVIYEHKGETTIGRVIALEGSIVDIKSDGTFTVNNTSPAEEVFYPTYPADGSDVKYPFIVPKGKVFILNDFREDTHDSRSFGAVDVKDLKGPLLFSMRRRGF